MALLSGSVWKVAISVETRTAWRIGKGNFERVVALEETGIRDWNTAYKVNLGRAYLIASVSVEQACQTARARPSRDRRSRPKTPKSARQKTMDPGLSTGREPNPQGSNKHNRSVGLSACESLVQHGDARCHGLD